MQEEPDFEDTYDSAGEALRQALMMARVDGASVYVCRGERIGCNAEGGSCDNCYKIPSWDRAPWIEHVRRYFKGDA